MHAKPMNTAPAVGRIVEFRRLLWRVDGISDDEFDAVPIEGSLAPRRFLTATLYLPR